MLEFFMMQLILLGKSILNMLCYNLRGIIIYLGRMSFFFNKSEGQQNLQYDDTAFLHFAISVCSVATITFLILIYKDIVNNRLLHVKTISKMNSFKEKLQKTEKSRKSYFKSVQFYYKLVVLLGCIAFGVFCYANIKEDSKMIGFDPHEILGVSLDAELITIKKAYRKLALQHHPDRNFNNPQVAAKFIQISKAYECLTDEQAKQKCKKYGNPDGTASYKVGIGLPRFMVDVGNQYFFLIPIFVFLLVVVPRAFISWSNRIKPMDTNGNLLVNYGTMHSLMIPTINPFTFPVLFGSMKELDAVFPEKKTLDENLARDFKALLVNSRAVPQQVIEGFEPHIIYRIYKTYVHMANKQRDEGIAKLVPELCRKITMFTLNYASKMMDQQPLANNPNWIRNYLGIYPVKLSSFFCKQMCNPSIRLGDTRSIQFLNLTPEEDLMAKNIPVGNLHDNLLWDDEKINSLVLNFSPDRQKYIREQIQCLPALKLQCRVLLGQEAVKQMTIDDFATLEVKVIRRKPTLGYVVAKDYPYLAREQFNIMISYNNNYMFFSAVEFKEGSNEAVFRCPHRQNVVRNMIFEVDVMSSNYPNMDLQGTLEVDVMARIQNRKIEIHPDDLNLEKEPKNFFEALASMEAYTEEDRQLSEGSDDEGQKDLKEKDDEPRAPQSHHGCDCGDDHDDHRPSFREEKEEKNYKLMG